jgi:hypothetical protein
MRRVGAKNSVITNVCMQGVKLCGQSLNHFFIQQGVQMSIQEIQKRVQASREDIIEFMREIVAIPSMDSQLKDVGEAHRRGNEQTWLR